MGSNLSPNFARANFLTFMHLDGVTMAVSRGCTRIVADCETTIPSGLHDAIDWN